MKETVRVVGFVIATLFLVFLGAKCGLNYFRRYQATRILATVREFHPGHTTEAQARRKLVPFAHYAPAGDAQQIAHPDSKIIVTLQNTWPFPWTYFSVQIDFLGRLVSKINLLEMQVDHPGYPHPNSASVTIYSNRLEQLPADFKGFSDSTTTTRGVDAEGNLNGFVCCHARMIKLDERATPVQLLDALNFQLSCMTSFVRCKDDHGLLP